MPAQTHATSPAWARFRRQRVRALSIGRRLGHSGGDHAAAAALLLPHLRRGAHATLGERHASHAGGVGEGGQARPPGRRPTTHTPCTCHAHVVHAPCTLPRVPRLNTCHMPSTGLGQPTRRDARRARAGDHHRQGLRPDDVCGGLARGATSARGPALSRTRRAPGVVACLPPPDVRGVAGCGSGVANRVSMLLHAARRPAGAGGSGRGPVPTPGPDHRTTPPSLR